MNQRRSFIVFYDGTCPLCQKIKQKIEKWDSRQLLTWRSIDERSVLEEYPFLDKKRIQKKMHVLENYTYLYTGFAAVKRIIQLFPVGKIIFLLFKLPGADYAGQYLYEWVAKNRHKLLRQECRSRTCEFHSKPFDR